MYKGCPIEDLLIVISTKGSDNEGIQILFLIRHIRHSHNFMI